MDVIEKLKYQILQKEKELEYYKFIAKKAGDDRLKEAEEYSKLTSSLKEKIQIIKKQHKEIRILSGLLPICASCKKIRDDNGKWRQLENYIKNNSEADFTHGICPDCMDNIQDAI